MSEHAGRLSSDELKSLLSKLHTYIALNEAAILLGASHCAGENAHLDGESFVRGFASYLEKSNLRREALIESLSLIMELSTYVRNGGVKALLYRLETGRCNLTPDFYDLLSNELCYKFDQGKLMPSLDKSSSFFQRLKAIDASDEKIVAASIAEIDELLIELGRRLEQVSLEELASKISAVKQGDS